MKTRSLAFKDNIVKQLADGRKTYHLLQVGNGTDVAYRPFKNSAVHLFDIIKGLSEDEMRILPNHCPLGTVGDRLYIKEACTENPKPTSNKFYIYRTDLPAEEHDLYKWKGSTQMPKGAARLFFEIVSVTVKRIQDLTEAEVEGSGIERFGLFGEFKGPVFVKKGIQSFKSFGTAEEALKENWNKLKAHRPYEENPFVFLLEIKKV